MSDPGAIGAGAGTTVPEMGAHATGVQLHAAPAQRAADGAFEPQPRFGVRWIVVALIAAVSVAAGIALALFTQLGSLVFTLPLATIVATAGVVVAAVLAITLIAVPAARARAHARVVRVRAETTEAERAAHRRFLARLDHELKNPVTAIRSALAVDGDAPAENVRIATSQATRLGALVGQLRALSALETQAIEQAPVDVAAIVEEEVQALRDEVAARGLRRELAVSMPTVPWPLPKVLGDADLLAVVVRNIVLNAVKYSSDGARVEVRGSEVDGRVLLEIADTGWGMRAEDVPYVWDELWRSADARGVEGTGLGLSLVRIAVQRHGGDVSLRSQQGRGTSVLVRLPVFAG